MIKVIPVVNNKGGVGKTTTSVSVAAGFARRGRRVLLVDLDSQGSASIALGVRGSDRKPGTAEALYGTAPLGDALRSTRLGTLDLLPGSLELAHAGLRLKTTARPQDRLGDVLAPVASRYDLIVIDCPPSTSILTINAITAAGAFIVPVSPSHLALEGVVSFGNVVRRIRREAGTAAPLLGLVLTCVRRTDKTTTTLVQQVRNHYGAKVFDAEIRHDPVLETAPASGVDVFGYAPSSQGAADYKRLVDEIADRLDRFGGIYGRLSDSG